MIVLLVYNLYSYFYYQNRSFIVLRNKLKFNILNYLLQAEESGPQVAFVCDRPAMYLTDKGWTKDDSTDCLKDPVEVLNYCRKVSTIPSLSLNYLYVLCTVDACFTSCSSSASTENVKMPYSILSNYSWVLASITSIYYSLFHCLQP